MDVTMPDGTVIQGVPDGTTKAQLTAKYSAHLRGQDQQPQSLGDQIGSYAHGIYAGLHSLPQSVAELGARGLDATGLTDNSYKNLHGAFQDMNSIAANGQTDNRFYKGGQIGGQIVSSLPAMELKAPAALTQALPRLATGILPKIATGAAQGAAASALTSNTSDAPLGDQMALGAAAGAALPMLGAAARLGGKGAADFLGGVTTGAGSNSIRGAFDAGVAGGERGKAFTDSMRGNTPWGEVVDQAKTALGKMRAARNSAYRSGMADVSKDATVLSFDPVDEAMNKASSVKSFKGQDLSPKTAAVRQEVDDAISNWKSLDPAEYHTPEGFDALKQQIGDIRDSLPFNTPQRVVADQAYGAVRGAIAKQAPAYDKVMADYSKASDLVSEVQRELSLGPKGNPNTALRKLQSVMRDNVNTGLGKRSELAKTLEDSGAKTLLPSLAGQALSTMIPRGLAKYGDLGLLASGASLATLPLASPRLVGEGAYLAGSAGRVAASGARGLFGSAAPRALAHNLRRLAAPSLGVTLPALVYNSGQ